MSKNPPSSILSKFRDLHDFPAFEAFARALWQDEAAVMVGAGFSRACSREHGSPAPPLWADFKTEMAIALGYAMGDEPDSLRLAQEYQTLHGDSGLDQLIHRLVADNQWEPGLLHKKLLEFPWRDVLTTNWDTLLERTKPQTPDRIYSCVRTIQDIPHRAQPRIVKLHGSLPSYKPFIFTEDDYRTYPVKFSPFVNLAQQVMLEHDLCLIGFSGIDPNFLAWSGWVRDTLNISARRIRLVGVLRLSPVSRALLERRNVTPIDLAPLVKDYRREEQHEKAIELFFDALLASEPPSPFSWNISPNGFSRPSSLKEEDQPTRMQIAREWAKEKNTYPGWLIAPYSETYKIRNNIVISNSVDDTPEANLRFSQEKIWRHKTKRVFLDPFDIKNADDHFDSAEHILTKTDKVEMCVSIASECRRHQKWDEWARWMERLYSIGSEEAALNHSYEEGQRAIFYWEYDKVIKAAGSITSNEPIWIMRRAGLLSTIFRHREAAELYQAALLSIRQKLLLNPKSAWLISLEAWASLFHQASYPALRDDYFSSPESESDKTRMRYVAAKADPWDIISHFENLASERTNRNRNEQEKWILSFKPGHYSLGEKSTPIGIEECPFYGLIELIERTGAPDTISNRSIFSSRLEAAYGALAAPDESDLLAFLARYHGSNTKILDWLMPRMKVASLTKETIDHLASAIPQRIECIERYQFGRGYENYLVFLLNLLARIVIRLKSDKALDIFKWTHDLINSPGFSWRIYSSSEEILGSAIEAMEKKERIQAIDLAIHMKTAGEQETHPAQKYWPEIFDFFSQDDFEEIAISSTFSSRIDTLISLVNNGEILDRRSSLMRLHTLYLADKLSPKQSKTLETAIWGRCKNNEWPRDTQLNPWVFLELPGSIKAHSLFNSKIVSAVAHGKLEKEFLTNLDAGLQNNDIIIPKDSIVSCVRSCLNWDPIKEIHEHEFNSLHQRSDWQDKVTSRDIGVLLARRLLPRLEVIDIPMDLAEQLQSPEKLIHISSLAAIAFQLVRLWPGHKAQAFALVRSAIASRDPMRVYPAYIAIKQFIENAAVESDIPHEVRELLLHACEQRTQPGLSSALEISGNMVTKGIMNTDSLDRLARSLPHVLEEYNYTQKNLEILSMAELPGIRKEVHRLSKLLADRYDEMDNLLIQLENDPLPEVRYLSNLSG